MPALRISIIENVRAKVGAIAEGIEDVRMLEAGATGVKQAIIRHFLAMPPNARGFPSSGFWGDAAQSVNQRIEGTDALVAVSKTGVRRRFFGTDGSISPPNTQFWAVPNQPETYGKMARDYPRDSMRFTHAQDENGDWHAALVDAGVAPVKRGETANTSPYTPDQVMFWLYRTIDQPANHDILPTEDEMYTEFADGVTEFIRGRLHDPKLQFNVSLEK